MGRFNCLSDEEKRVVLEIAKANRGSWRLSQRFGGDTHLVGIDMPGHVSDAPYSEAFYLGLAQKGFITVAEDSAGLQLHLQQLALDYQNYVEKSDLSRWCEDRRYELAGERTVWAKVLWHSLSFVLGFLSAVLLRLLGWIRIGN